MWFKKKIETIDPVRLFVKKIGGKFIKGDVVFKPKELVDGRYAEYIISDEPVIVWRIAVGGAWYIYTLSDNKEIILELNYPEEDYIRTCITAYEKPIHAEIERNNAIIAERVIKQIEEWP